MAERDVSWKWSPRRVALGDSTTEVPQWVKLHGTGLRGAPDLHVEMEVRDGVPEVTEFQLKAKPDGRGIRTADLRVFALDGLAYNAFVRVPDSWGTDNYWGAPPADEREAWAKRGQFEASRSSRRRGVTPGELDEVARVYLQNAQGRPAEAVQTELGYSRRTADRRIRQARDAGLLPGNRSEA